MKTQSSITLGGSYIFFVGLLGVIALIVIFYASRALTPSSTFPLLVTALGIAVLDRFPIHLDPQGELHLTIVIAIPAMVLFGWQPTIVGAAIGLTAGALIQPSRYALTQGIERVASLIVPASLATALRTPGPYGEVAVAVAAGLGHSIVRTLLESSRMLTEESISWSRTIRFLAKSTFSHQGVFTAVAASAVWVFGSESSTNRLMVPILAAAVTLQVYLPRILRGLEQRRVLAAVSVLAAAVDAKDPYTAGHSAEVARLSRRVARILGLDEPEVHRVYLGGLLHDVGKMVVPTAILLKPGKLTDEEWQVMRSHVDAGVRIVESIGGLADVAPIVAASHEQLDGRGYPSALKDNDIPLGSRISLVVDAYNALTTDRPYRAARSTEAALKELAVHAGTQFDPNVIAALRIALAQPRKALFEVPPWMNLLQQPAFGFLWAGQLVSFLGDEIFFIALTLQVYQLTRSATILAVTLVAATVGQGLLGLLAGALADRMDRRGLMIASDLTRAALVAALPLVILRSIPGGLFLLIALNIGTVFFRAAVYALVPSVVPRDQLPTGNALFQTTERIAEIIGGVLGSAIVLSFGYSMAFYLDALSFIFSAACVGLMPIAWRAGLETKIPNQIFAEIGEGLRYIWDTPLHRVLAMLILPGYLTLAFTSLRAPMIMKTAGLSIIAYGVINSAIGMGKLVAAVSLTTNGRHWVNMPFIIRMFILTAVAIGLFGSTTIYPALILGAFLFGLGNIATLVANLTLSMFNTPSYILGRLLASRQVFIAVTTLLGMLTFGWLADALSPPTALVALSATSASGVLGIWLWAGRQLPRRISAPVAGGATD